MSDYYTPLHCTLKIISNNTNFSKRAKMQMGNIIYSLYSLTTNSNNMNKQQGAPKTIHGALSSAITFSSFLEQQHFKTGINRIS